MTRKTFLFAGTIALAITTTSTITRTHSTTETHSTPEAQTTAVAAQTRSHYPWHNSYKAVVDQTAAVVQGVVTDIKETYDEREGPRTHVTLSHLLVLWGEFRPTSVTLRLFGGPLPGRGRRVDEVHIPTFVRGKMYLVFLSNREWRLSPVTAHQAFIIERVRDKNILVTTNGRAIYGINDATGPIPRFAVYRIPNQIPDNFVPEINTDISSKMVANAYSPAQFASILKIWAKRNGVTVNGTFNDRPFTTGDWRINKTMPDRNVGTSSDKHFEPRPGVRETHKGEEERCWNRTTPTDSDPKDRSPLCREGGEK